MSKSTKRKIGALAIAAAIGVAVVVSMLGAQGGEEATTSADETPTVAPESSPEAQAIGVDDAPANGVDDDDSGTEPTLSVKQKIEQTGNEWAPLFAAGHDRAACQYQGQPLCERIACERVGGFKIRNCTPPSSAFRNSFERATVQDIAIKGDRAAVRFSNGEVVELEGDADPSPLAGVWYIHKLVGNAGRGSFE